MPYFIGIVFMKPEKVLFNACKIMYEKMIEMDKVYSGFSESDFESVLEYADEDFLKSIRFVFTEEHLLDFDLDTHNKFRECNNSLWGSLLDSLQRYISFITWLIQSNNQNFLPKQNDPKESVRIVVLNLFARCCLIGKEILCLLRNGYPDAAISRWRTLNEVANTLYFIMNNGTDCAVKYLDHYIIDEYNTQKVLKDSKRNNPDKLNHIDFDEEVFNELQTRKSELVSKYGSKFASDYGWIDGFVPDTGRYGVRTIEKHAGMEHISPFSKLANHSVHSSSLSMTASLSSDEKNIMQIGSSNNGLLLPIDCTICTLHSVTTKVLKYYSSINSELQKTNQLSIIILEYQFHEIRRALSEKHKSIK